MIPSTFWKVLRLMALVRAQWEKPIRTARAIKSWGFMSTKVGMSVVLSPFLSAYTKVWNNYDNADMSALATLRSLRDQITKRILTGVPDGEPVSRDWFMDMYYTVVAPASCAAPDPRAAEMRAQFLLCLHRMIPASGMKGFLSANQEVAIRRGGARPRRARTT